MKVLVTLLDELASTGEIPWCRPWPEMEGVPRLHAGIERNRQFQVHMEGARRLQAGMEGELFGYMLQSVEYDAAPDGQMLATLGSRELKDSAAPSWNGGSSAAPG